MSIANLLDSGLEHYDGNLIYFCPDMGTKRNMVLPRKVNFRSRFLAKTGEILGFEGSPVNGACFRLEKSDRIWATSL